jgi:hypothetical protein
MRRDPLRGHRLSMSAIMIRNVSRISSLMIEGSRFPWTTGSITVTAVGRGPHKTVHYGMGYDNRYTEMTTNGATHLKGTIQLVSPTMTRWLLPAVASWETAGIGILRIKFVPEPSGWLMLGFGSACLAVARRC